MRRIGWFALAVVASGCGQTADLGENAEPGPNAPGSSGGSDAATVPSGDLVYRANDVLNGTRVLVISGDHLYFPVAKNGGLTPPTQLTRCEKKNCTKTAQVILEGPSSIETLQTFGDRIGIVEVGNASALATCAMPDCTDLVRIGGLHSDVGGCHFEAGSVEWSQFNDRAVYRCALPDCDGGPQLVFSAISAHAILRSGEVTILHTGSSVWRVSGDASTLELLELGAESRSLGGPGSEASDDPEAALGEVAIDGDWLYGSLHSGCTTASGFCTVARWPLRGYGPREVILTGERLILGFSVHRGELAALTFPLDVAPGEASGVVFCRTDACSDTLHEVFAPGWMSAIVADDDRWYWAWNSDVPQRNMEIRSAPRLSAP